MAKIIISYRRSDSDVFAGRVHDRIARRYGERSAFIDVDNIPFGKDFRVHIQQELANADAVLVIIGSKWLGSAKGGRSRIMEVTDPVRIEVETALAKGVPTIPILVGKTIMPRPDQLPETLKDFPFLNAAPVDTSRDFHRDLDRIIATIDQILGLPADAIGNVERPNDDRRAAEAPVQVRAEEVWSGEPERLAGEAEAARRREDEERQQKAEAQAREREAERQAIEEQRLKAEAIKKAEIAESERAAATVRADEEARRQAAAEATARADAETRRQATAAAAVRADEDARRQAAATTAPASTPAPRAKASLFEIKLWSYPTIAVVGVALGCIAGLANAAGLAAAYVANVSLLSAIAALFAAALALMTTKLTANSGVGRAITAFVGLYVLSIGTSVLYSAAIRALPDAELRNVVAVFNVTVTRLIFWVFVAAVLLPFGKAMRDAKTLAAVAGAGVIQGLCFVILVAIMISTGSRALLTYLYPIVSFGITLPVFAYGVRRQAAKS